MALRMMRYRIRSFGQSDVGLVRDNNEDVWAELTDIAFYVLADGMGGHQAGEIAAKESVDSLCRLVKEALRPHRSGRGKTLLEAHASIQNAIQEVNQFIYKMSSSDENLRGMGTTLCCVHVHDQGLIYGHVGDSRIYRMRGGHLEQMTKDHSLLSELLDLGQIDDGDAEEFIYKNIITKAIGTGADLEPSVHLSDIQMGDIYLLCSDGLSDIVSPMEIEEILLIKNRLEEAGSSLINCAKAKGGPDNITVLLLKIEEGD